MFLVSEKPPGPQARTESRRITMYLTTETARAEVTYRRQHLADLYRESRSVRPHRRGRRGSNAR